MEAAPLRRPERRARRQWLLAAAVPDLPGRLSLPRRQLRGDRREAEGICREGADYDHARHGRRRDRDAARLQGARGKRDVLDVDEVASPSTSSLRAQRSNPESFRGGTLDCFATLAMTERIPAPLRIPPAPRSGSRRGC